MKREEHIEHLVRQRLAEALSSAGVGYDRISLEVLYLMPPSFLEAYIEVYTRAFKDASTKGAGDPNSLPTERPKKGQVGPASNNSGKKYREHWQIKDDKAFALKRRVDKKLGKLARELKTGASNEELHRVRCGSCGRWVSDNWSYCAWCGRGVGHSGVLKMKDPRSKG